MGIATNFSDFGSQVVYRPVDIIGSEIPHWSEVLFFIIGDAWSNGDTPVKKKLPHSNWESQCFVTSYV